MIMSDIKLVHIKAVLIILIVLHNTVGSYRILVTPFQYPSHIMVMRGLTEGLIKEGHEVYFALSDLTETPKGLEEDGFKVLRFHTRNKTRLLTSQYVEELEFESVIEENPTFSRIISEFCGEECYDMDADKAFLYTIKDINFHLVVLDTFPPSLCKHFIPAYLDVPFASYTSGLQMETTRIPLLPSVVPFIFLGQTPRMTFPWRFLNTIITIISNIPDISYMLTNVYDYKLLNKYNTDPQVRTWYDYARKSSLTIVTYGPTLDFPTASLPHILTLECILCSKGKPIPHYLEKRIFKYSGIIIVTFGSTIKALPKSVALKFITAFSQMKELVIWRYDGILPGTTPENVKVMKWLPQNDLLAHPKTKLFITHAGNNGQYESVCHGVPMLAFPVLGDQPFNALRMVEHGYGLRCNIRNFTSDELVHKMKSLLDFPSFRERTSIASKMLQTQLVSPKEKATFYLKHILEFGSDHLRTLGLDMPWYSYYMLDILLVLYLILTFWLVISIVVCVYIYRKCLNRRQKLKSD